jgi:HSP20 family protein
MTDDTSKRDDRPVYGLPRGRDPFHSFREEMERLFDTFLGGLPSRRPGEGSPMFPMGQMRPSVDVKETEGEIVVTADLPGIDEKDITLTLKDGVLAIRGEKTAERKEEQENYHMMERSYGSFQRSIRLPDTIDEDQVEARFEKGVLTVTLKKRPEAARAHKRIEIKSTG